MTVRFYPVCVLPILLLAACQIATTPQPTRLPIAPLMQTAPTVAVTPHIPTQTPTATMTITAIPSGTPLPVQIIDSFGADMLLIPAGEFTMGSDSGFPDEAPVHTVYADAFYLDRLETTNDEYHRCVTEGDCAPPKIVGCNTPEPMRYLIRHPNYYDNPAFADYPVICLDWYQAVDYCTWRSARLPTEAEWEKAARGPDARLYPWGDDPPTPDRVSFLWPEGEFEQTPDYIPSPVGSYPDGASPYGILDMAGNVYEWVQDVYDPEYYASSPYDNPTGPPADSGKWRVARGGSFWNLPNRIRSANRNNAYLPADLAHFDAGVRCALDAPIP